MRRLLKSFKTEINPTQEQKVKINKTIGTCRYIYNFYLAHNKELHDNGGKFMNGKSFSVWLNNEYLPNHPEYQWIKEVSSKSVKKSIEDGCIAFTRFFKGQSKFPNFKKKGEAIQRKNIQKQKLKVQRLHHRINNIRTDYINKTIAEILKAKPSYITIEDLNVSGMMKNRHLSKTVASQKFYEFRTKLKSKCDDNGIELRVADRWYPSSKLCHCCGCIKKDLKLSDRIYRCGCGYIEDRDFNAALNLRDAATYKIA